MINTGIKYTLIRALLCLSALALVIVGLDRLFPPPIDRGNKVSAVVSDRNGQALRAFPIEDGRWRMAASLDRIDPKFIDALIAVEDKRFYDHNGVDLLALSRATRDMVRFGKITSGASTITMQTARLLEPRPRHLGSKLLEMLRAFQLESRLTKDEILELYLTLTPYGGNLESLRAASWAWFGREPNALSTDQIALLIALPQSPEVRRPDRRPEHAKSARKDVLDRMVSAGLLTEALATDAADETLPTERHAFPQDAWHVAEKVRTLASQSEIRSTIDIRLQHEAKNLLRQLAQDGGPGVQASAMIIELESRKVRASVGSGGRDLAGGWIDLTDRRRSPGSTLKPFIYAMAFDDGIASATTRINDLPARFASYLPENFDRTFRGEITIAQALQHSLNVPAVHVLDRIGANRFVSAIRYTGGQPALPTNTQTDVGLAIALGGFGLSVQDLATLYTALGNRGVAHPLNWLEDIDENEQDLAEGFALVSEESASEILSILATAPPPPGRMPASLSTQAPQIAFKTGTSYGYRDAWAAGVGNGYAIIVWTGRPDGAPRPGVTGRMGALPTLFKLFDLTQRAGPVLTQSFAPIKVGPAGTSSALSRFSNENLPPEIIFPPHNTELWSDNSDRGFALAARGQEPLRWYANGLPIPLDEGGSTYWTPTGAGFHELMVVDRDGRSVKTGVRVRTQ